MRRNGADGAMYKKGCGSSISSETETGRHLPVVLIMPASQVGAVITYTDTYASKGVEQRMQVEPHSSSELSTTLHQCSSWAKYAPAITISTLSFGSSGSAS
eukprot:GHUV01030522.1.p2 GENE.GHUV01030522.1~~GHUV01030522.1.p2  ORF type:complete len:101 (+),score=7.87 GHUV01030522.1:542-844(+)